MKAIRTLMAICAVTAVSGCTGAVSIFDGKTFSGWEGNMGWFRIEEGAIVAGSLTESIPQNEFLCTGAEYDNFELSLKVRLMGKGQNAGIQFRSQRVPNSNEVSGYQADMGMGGGKIVWGSLYDESRRNRFLATADQKAIGDIVRDDQWNKYRIRCAGNHVELWVNGYKTVDYWEADESIPKKGVIGLQIHSGPPAEAWYKDIVITEIN